MDYNRARDEYAYLIKTLWDLDQALDEMSVDILEIRSRISRITDAHQIGTPLKDTFPEGRSVVIRKLSDLSLSLDRYGSRVRRSMALQLRREQVSGARIAEIFGVSRQRVSKILQEVDKQPV